MSMDFPRAVQDALRDEIKTLSMHRRIVISSLPRDSENEGKYILLFVERFLDERVGEHRESTCNFRPETIHRWFKGHDSRFRKHPVLLQAIETFIGAYHDDNDQTFGKKLAALRRDASEMQERSDALRAAANSIPSQNPTVLFRVSKDTKLSLAPALNGQNDYPTIEAIRSELIAPQGPLGTLIKRYANSPNVPQASLFRPLIEMYQEELSKNPKQINYALLFARGSRITAARRSAALQIKVREWPELDAQENEAIDAICQLHGPLILASSVGRRLVADAKNFDAPSEVFDPEHETIESFCEMMAAETELVETESAEMYRELTAISPDDPAVARSRGLRMGAVGSALAAIVGGAVWYGAGGAVATLVVPAAAVGATGVIGGFVWEAIKTMPSFKDSTFAVGGQFEEALAKAEKQADKKEAVLLKGLAGLVARNRVLFERVANLRPEFHWVKDYLKKIAGQRKK